MAAWLWTLVTLALVVPASAELRLPPGFIAQVYVSGQGFDPSADRGAHGIPATSTLGVDQAGVLYLARTGARFRQGEVDDLGPIYRIPLGGARLTPDTEARYFHGPPLRNPQVAAVRGRGEIFVTTFDRDRKLGALYRVTDGRPALFAGGTPPAGTSPLLRHPEGVALDAAGRVYVADREQGLVLRLAPTGQVLDPQYALVTRARMLAVDETGQLWVAGDGSAETPFQDGAGQFWKIGPGGQPTLVLEGPLSAGLSLSPGGTLFVAQRRANKIFAFGADGKRIEFATATEGTILRSLAFVPVTPETRQAGIAGDLLVIAVPRQIWSINEVIRITGPFAEFIRQQSQTTP